VSYAASGLLMSEMSIGSTTTRRFVDHSLVISSRSSSVSYNRTGAVLGAQRRVELGI
jgi:hypothetical protein